MGWDKYCVDNASTPDSNGWLILIAGALVVIGVFILVVVL